MNKKIYMQLSEGIVRKEVMKDLVKDEIKNEIFQDISNGFHIQNVAGGIATIAMPVQALELLFSIVKQLEKLLEKEMER